MAKLFFGDVGVDLRGSDGAVAEELLDLTDVASFAHKFKSDSMPESVRRILSFKARSFHPPLQIMLNCPATKSSPFAGNKKRRILLHLLKFADYDARTKKLGLILSEKGIKLLCSEIKGSL